MKSCQMRYASVLLTPAVALQLQMALLLLATPLWARPNLLENATGTGGDPELHHHHHHHHHHEQPHLQQQQSEQQPAESRGQQAEQLIGLDGSDSELVAQRIVNHHPDHHHHQQRQEQEQQQQEQEQEQQQLSAQMAPLAVNRYSDNPLLNSDSAHQPLIPDQFIAPAEPLTPIEHHHNQQQQHQQQISPEDLNTHPLGGPAGPLGAVVEQCPGPEWALPCESRSDCDPFTGFVVRDGVTLAAPITKDTPTVALLRCRLAGAVTVGVCCKRLPTKVTPPPTGGPVNPTSTAAGWSIPAALSHTAGNKHEPSNTRAEPTNPFLPEYTHFKRQQQQNGAHANPFLTNSNQLQEQQNQNPKPEPDNIEHGRRDENSINNTPLSEYNQQHCPCQQHQQQYKSGRIQPRNAV